ncbi:MarR family winged helix-turn-helix transcriptional regulator [Microbacterium stercoris]|uniref:MarR family transcriptional regulator n=1 Tax=Microbacterium stercoris TaxID=2820289 RepID=A0A939QS11_9MICO|nr:MarR family transcriptional regulator [Microbacterium stercoris]MBO3664058.1 MarR family transcriptional regulator [Microbacterium stercoris]
MHEGAEHGELAGERLETWAGLATLLEWLPVALDAQLQRDAGLTHFEYGVLYALAHAPERALRMSVLAGYANGTLSRLSRAVTRLERDGWVRRSRDPEDGRSTRAVLTEAGLDKMRQATPGHQDTVRRLVLDRLTGPQERQLRGITRRILDAIEQERQPDPESTPRRWGPSAARPE